jgi:hypothetical protein
MKLKFLIAASVAAACTSSFAQAPKPGAVGGTVVASEPGKAAVVNAAEVTATVTSIDKASRIVTLKGPEGRSVDVVAGSEVKNFDQIHVGDRVTVQYQEALSLELRKVRSNAAPTVAAVAGTAKPGDRPAALVGQEITALADVVAVDPKKSIISLKGPRGNVIDLKVRNPEQFKVVKKGDQVEVVYTQAVAMAVMPAKAAAKK